MQYLEALCRDLGRPHDEFTKKLDKLRRSAPAAMVTQAGGGGGAVTRAERPMPERPQRQERPMPERPARDTAPANNRTASVEDQLGPSASAGR